MMDSLAGDSFNMEFDASSEETEKILIVFLYIQV